MTIQQWLDNVGNKADIKNGIIVISEDGFLTISDNPMQYSAYVNERSSTITAIIPKTDYRGRIYSLKEADCVTLAAEWYDTNKGTNILKFIDSLSIEEYRMLWGNSFVEYLLTLGFTKREGLPQKGDVVYYERPNHIGIYLGDGKILHHLPRKLSCIDELDYSKLGDVYGQEA